MFKKIYFLFVSVSLLCAAHKSFSAEEGCGAGAGSSVRRGPVSHVFSMPEIMGNVASFLSPSDLSDLKTILRMSWPISFVNLDEEGAFLTKEDIAKAYPSTVFYTETNHGLDSRKNPWKLGLSEICDLTAPSVLIQCATAGFYFFRNCEMSITLPFIKWQQHINRQYFSWDSTVVPQPFNPRTVQYALIQAPEADTQREAIMGFLSANPSVFPMINFSNGHSFLEPTLTAYRLGGVTAFRNADKSISRLLDMDLRSEVRETQAVFDIVFPGTNIMVALNGHQKYKKFHLSAESSPHMVRYLLSQFHKVDATHKARLAGLILDRDISPENHVEATRRALALNWDTIPDATVKAELASLILVRDISSEHNAEATRRALALTWDAIPATQKARLARLILYRGSSPENHANAAARALALNWETILDATEKSRLATLILARNVSSELHTEAAHRALALNWDTISDATEKSRLAIAILDRDIPAHNAEAAHRALALNWDTISDARLKASLVRVILSRQDSLGLSAENLAKIQTHAAEAGVGSTAASGGAGGGAGAASGSGGGSSAAAETNKGVKRPKVGADGSSSNGPRKRNRASE